ncbi:hypothetical protein COM97_03495 [Bacillus thuringiensis]|nr:hypothetical protein COM97_03495 [Bacillus thuringiensis]
MINTSKYEYDEHSLKLIYDNGQEFLFNSKTDANEYWVEAYTKSIIKLYNKEKSIHNGCFFLCYIEITH